MASVTEHWRSPWQGFLEAQRCSQCSSMQDILPGQSRSTRHSGDSGTYAAGRHLKLALMAVSDLTNISYVFHRRNSHLLAGEDCKNMFPCGFQLYRWPPLHKFQDCTVGSNLERQNHTFLLGCSPHPADIQLRYIAPEGFLEDQEDTDTEPDGIWLCTRLGLHRKSAGKGPHILPCGKSCPEDSQHPFGTRLQKVLKLRVWSFLKIKI